MTNKAEEFICYQCLESFSLSVDELRATGGNVVCPKCGSGQSGDALDPDTSDPKTDDELPFDSEFSNTLVTSIPPEVMDAVANNMGILAGKLPPSGNDPSVDQLNGNTDSTSHFGTPITASVLPPLDPHGVNWKLKTPIGITYNFFGIDAVLNWSQSKKDLSGMAVTIEGITEWRDFGDFRRRLRTSNDPITAFHGAVRPGEPIPVVPEPSIAPPVAVDVVAPAHRPRASVLSPEPQTSKATKVAKKAPASTGSQTENSGNKPQQPETPRKPSQEKSGSTGMFKEAGKPTNGSNTTVASSLPTSSTTRTPGSFTFRVEPQPQKKPSRGFAFTLGFILGSAAVFALWFFDVLDRLPIAK